MLPPLAIGIAVTRYRLYEIDRLISRGLSWAVLSGLLLAVYGGAILLLQTLLGGVIRGQTLAVAGSTLVAAALFQPLRRRIQAAVDHRFNRARYDAERTAIDFAERLRDEVDLGLAQRRHRRRRGHRAPPDHDRRLDPKTGAQHPSPLTRNDFRTPNGHRGVLTTK